MNLYKVLLLFVGLSMSSMANFAQAEPKSGYFATTEYGVNAKGEATEEKRINRIWFHGPNVRREFVIGSEVLRVSVSGENSWLAAPAAGRLVRKNQPYVLTQQEPLITHPEIIRRSFLCIFGEKKKQGEEVIKGFPAWIFSWQEPEHSTGDIGSPAQEVKYWIYADENFPITLAREIGDQEFVFGRQELLDLRLNDEVAPELFLPPQNLAEVQPFDLPRRKFVIELHQERESLQYGWKTKSDEIFKGDGEKVTRRYTNVSTQKDGKANTFAPPVETMNYEKARGELWRRVQIPDWFSYKKTGQDTQLNLQADILERVSSTWPKEKLWIVTHPLLSTLAAFRQTNYNGDVTHYSIKRIEFN